MKRKNDLRVEKTLKVVNELERKRIIEKYAIGGGIATIFYMEPVLTYDLDIFVFLPQTQRGLVTVSPIYKYLRGKGYKAHQEHIVIEGVPVQFIPAYNDLVEEAVREAREIRFKGTKTRVLRAEHLLAIMLQTNRPKDRARMTQQLEETKIDMNYLTEILGLHGLRRNWNEFKKRFYEE